MPRSARVAAVVARTAWSRALVTTVEAGAKGGTCPAVLAAADEVAIDQFVGGAISFTGMAKVVDATLSAHSPKADPNLDDVLAADAWAREFAMQRAAPVPASARRR